MEETIYNPTQINSVKGSQVLYTKIACLNKKRKFSAEQLGLPLPKQKCSSSYALQCSSSSPAIQEELNPYLFKGETSGRSAYNTSQPTSGNGSNSFSEHVDCIMSISESEKASLYDQPSTSYVNCSNCFEKSVYSLESRSVTKSSCDKMESSYTGGEKDLLSHNFGLHSSPIYEDYPLEFESHEDYSCAEYSAETIEACSDKEIEDLLYSNRANPDNFVLSSGRWTLNKDAEQGANKLTIDKEFEQYFSMLML